MKLKALLLISFLTIGLLAGCTSAQVANLEVDINTAALDLQKGLILYENNKENIDSITSKALALALKVQATHQAASDLVGIVNKIQDPVALAQAKSTVAKIISNTTVAK